MAVTVIAVLAAIAITVYGHYTDRARGVEILGKYDAIRTGAMVTARTRTVPAEDCAEISRALDSTNLSDRNATLSYAFEAVQGGFRPVLSVCAQAAQHGPAGVRTAREVYDTLSRNRMVENAPVLTDSVVSFALRLTDGDASLCKAYRPQPPSGCQAQAGVVAPTPASGVGTVATQPGSGQPSVAQQSGSGTSQPSVPPTPLGQGTVSSPVVAQVPQPPTTGTLPPSNVGTGGPATAVSKPIDFAAIKSSISQHIDLAILNPRDQNQVVNLAMAMLTDPAYLRTVNSALAGLPPTAAIDLPSYVPGQADLPLTGQMHRILNKVFAEAVVQLCLARGGSAAACGNPTATTSQQPGVQTRPPSGGSGGASSSTSAGGNKPVDYAAVRARISQHVAMEILNPRDQNQVVNVAMAMVSNPAYLRTVNNALAGLQPTAAIDLPSFVPGQDALPFTGQMHRILNLVYAEAVVQVCLARGGNAATCS